MTTQRIALLFGVVFVLVGVCGFVLNGAGMESSMLLGLFPVNGVHNSVHTLFGIWGLAASRNAGGATAYCKIGGVIYLLLGVVGFGMENPMGLVPLGGNDRYLHLALGVVLAGVGFSAGGKAAA